MHRSTLTRLCGAFTVAVVAISFAPATTPTATASTAAAGGAAAPRTEPTHFLLGAMGYASRVVGGDLPANSGKTAFQVIGCTNRAGIDRSNTKADVNVPGGLLLSNVKTRTWTAKNGETVSSYSRNSIERVVLADTKLGSLAIDAVVSRTRAWHNGTGFHSSATSDVARIVFDPAIGDPQQIKLPLPGKTVTIPGLAEISLGSGEESHGASTASAQIDAIKVHVIPTNTTVYLAHALAVIRDQVPPALYRGSAFGTRADVAEGLVSSQNTPNIVTPCRGSDGEVRSQDVAEVDVTTGVVARVLRATTRSGENAEGHGYVKNTAKVGRIALGHGLVITAVEGRAYVTKIGKRFVKNTKGTTLGRIILNGERLQMPETGVLEIPGVAKIESKIIERSRTSIEVTALRVTLLDGRLATLDIGHARSALIPTCI
jgi:hypothetical protein